MTNFVESFCSKYDRPVRNRSKFFENGNQKDRSSSFGDVINRREIEIRQLTDSLGSVLSSSATKLCIHERFSDREFEESSFCKCGVCYNVFGNGGIPTSETFGVPDYKICDRTYRLNETSRLQEGECWKCRSQCWKNYSLSHAWAKKRNQLPKYKRRAHQPVLKLPEISEQRVPFLFEGEWVVPGTAHPQTEREQSIKTPYERATGPPNGQRFGKVLKLPSIRSSNKLAANMLPYTVVAEVMGVTPSKNFHYNEKTDAQMRWLLIKASMRRLIRMDNEKKMMMRENFATMMRDVKLMEQQKEEEERLLREMEQQMKLEQTKETVIRKIRLSKFKNSMEKVLKDERDKRDKEQQLSEARRKLLSHKINMFKVEIESDQKQFNQFFFPRTMILVETKRTTLRKQLFRPETRPKLYRSQSVVTVQERYVDSLWMEPQIDAFLAELDWLNEAILNKMRTDFLERVSRAFNRPLKSLWSKSCPEKLNEDVVYKFCVAKRQGIEGMSKTIESLNWGSEKEEIGHRKRYMSAERGLDKIDPGTDVDVIYNSFVYQKKKKAGEEFIWPPPSKKLSTCVKSSQLSHRHSKSLDDKSPKRITSAPSSSNKLDIDTSFTHAKAAQKSIVLDLRNLKSYGTLVKSKDNINSVNENENPTIVDVERKKPKPATGVEEKGSLKKLRRVSVSLGKAKQETKQSIRTGPKTQQNRIAQGETKMTRTPWGRIKTVVKAKTIFDAQPKKSKKVQLQEEAAPIITVREEAEICASIVLKDPDEFVSKESIGLSDGGREATIGEDDSKQSPTSSVDSIDAKLTLP